MNTHPEEQEALAWLDEMAARSSPGTKDDPLGQRGERYARIIKGLIKKPRDVDAIAAEHLTLRRLRHEYTVEGWNGETIVVHFHPSIYAQVHDLPGFVRAINYRNREPRQNEAGALEYFVFFFDRDLEPETWAIRPVVSGAPLQAATKRTIA